MGVAVIIFFRLFDPSCFPVFLLTLPHSCVPWSKVAILGMVIQPLIGNPYNGNINPYYWVDDHPLLYGNNGSLDPSTYDTWILSGSFANIAPHNKDWPYSFRWSIFLKKNSLQDSGGFFSRLHRSFYFLQWHHLQACLNIIQEKHAEANPISSMYLL